MGTTRWLLATVTAASLAACSTPEDTTSQEAIVPLPTFSASHGPPSGKAAYDAAAAFQGTLSEQQAARLVLPINSPLRRNWSNLPDGAVDFERNGLRLGDLQADQLAALFDFLAAALSEHGYETVAQVIAAEAVLSVTFLARFDRLSATNYRLALFGEPTPDGPWGWQFGGHHLAINASLNRGRVLSLSPTHVGIEPARFAFEGERLAPLADELADARALMRALPAGLRADVLVADRPRDVYTGPGNDGLLPAAEGGSVADWPDDARGMLLDIASHWLRLQPEENALSRLGAIESALDDTHFAWHGPIEGDGDVYYRIQGPTLIVEFSARIDGGGGHYHTVYRDPTNEYGGAL